MVFSPKLVMLINTNMKILNSPSISSFGGLNFVLTELDSLGINDIIEQHLPQLSKQSKYSWKDLLYSFWSVFYCGGDCAEDLAFNLKRGFHNNPFIKFPSPDRVLERLKSLKEPSVICCSKRGKADNEFSINERLNLLNIKILNKLPSFQRHNLVLDYDNTFIYAQKADAKRTYTKGIGYCPGVGIIGNNIVYVENRNGNCAPHTLQEDSIERMMKTLSQEGITVESIRADSASYMFETIIAMRKYASTIFVRAKMSGALDEAIKSINHWTKINVDGREMYRGSTTYTPFKRATRDTKKKHLLEAYRIVVTKEKRNDGQINLFTGEAYNYSAIMTNDIEKSDNEVVYFYNQRGAVEREFDVLKNDFGWNKMPFSKIEQNTVFLIITAMCRNLYQHIITNFSKRFKVLSPSFRIKKFIFRFISMPAKWIKTGRTYKLRLYGDLAYDP